MSLFTWNWWKKKLKSCKMIVFHMPSAKARVSIGVHFTVVPKLANLNEGILLGLLEMGEITK